MPSPFVWILAAILVIFTSLMIIAYMTPGYGVSTSVPVSVPVSASRSASVSTAAVTSWIR